MKEKLTKFIFDSKYVLSKHSPEILMGLGIAGTIVSTVIACRQTLKVDDYLEDAKKDIDNVHRATKLEDVDYTEEDARKDLTII